ncbi:hypothetical protein V1514DRAFT_325115 [Lipomyces japonicus]|uniref:uncharacterized protein n=1 Tax=Lipomyces japonicus TaxID=56871 RepID=UPI0034CFA852
MSSADVRDMLDLPSQPTLARPPPPPKRQKTEGKKLDGIQRELQNLLGENTPAVSVIENKFKAKPNWMKKPSPWFWSKFSNSARTDGLELHHWIRGTPTEDEYAFAKFNKSVDVPEYSKEEYDSVLADTAWTPRETYYLFDLCREYELRWHIIQDRYEYTPEEDEPPSLRTVEDLKERYYHSCRKLMEYRREKSGLDWSPKDLELYNSINFNKEKEITRKQYLERLLSRSPAEIAEEERLILEYRKLQESSKKLVQERSELLHLLESPQTSQSFSQFETNQGLSQLASNLLAADKNRKRKLPDQAVVAQANQKPGTGQSQQPTTPNSKNHPPAPPARPSAPPQPSKAEQAQSNTAKKIAKKVPLGEEARYGISFHDKLVPGVFLRSTKISTLKPTVQAKVSSVLTELGISQKLAMPTAKVCERFEMLQQSISVLLEAKKQVDKLEAEVKVLKAQKSGEHPI